MLGCKSAPKVNNNALCYLKFDFSDKSLNSLNTHNKRTVKTFTEFCESVSQ